MFHTNHFIIFQDYQLSGNLVFSFILNRWQLYKNVQNLSQVWKGRIDPIWLRMKHSKDSPPWICSSSPESTHKNHGPLRLPGCSTISETHNIFGSDFQWVFRTVGIQKLTSSNISNKHNTKKICCKTTPYLQAFRETMRADINFKS